MNINGAKNSGEREGSTCIALELDDLDLEIKDLRL